MEDQVKKVEVSDRLFKVIAILIAAILVNIAVGLIFRALDRDLPREMSFSGEGRAVVKSDVAVMSFGYNASGGNAKVLMGESSKKVGSAIEAIKKLGIDEADIKTTRYSLTPQYDAYGKPSGYIFDESIEVKLKDFEKIEKVLDEAAKAGMNMVDGVTFRLDDPEAALSEARDLAIENARKKAEAVVPALGLRLGKVLYMYEEQFPVYSEKDDLGAGAPVEYAYPTIEPGQEEVTVRVNISYRVK
ncbi:MAG: SIMPL domain-containing protein [Actinomycetota bacterium]|nr:SIMPL domain-containing protein [Actinomycetota bacterium]